MTAPVETEIRTSEFLNGSKFLSLAEKILANPGNRDLEITGDYRRFSPLIELEENDQVSQFRLEAGYYGINNSSIKYATLWRMEYDSWDEPIMVAYTYASRDAELIDYKEQGLEKLEEIEKRLDQTTA